MSGGWVFRHSPLYRSSGVESMLAHSSVSEIPTEAPSESKRMPIGVRTIDPTEIVRQRAAGWPDFHPEEFCHRCGGRNVTSWYADSEAWNLATDVLDRGRGEILCPQCFTELHEAATGEWRTWELRATR